MGIGRNPYVAFDSVYLSYPRLRNANRNHWALENVSFKLTRGDRLGIMGLNGAGKSTLLKTIASIYTPHRGNIEVVGKVGAIFNASLGFIPQATGIENIFLRGAMMGQDINHMRHLLPSIVDFSGLGEDINRPLNEYSSGMALRLAFSISTSLEVDILLLDEWLGAGDADFIKRARIRMESLIENSGILALATHNTALLRKICNKGILIDNGKALAFGDIESTIDVFNNHVSGRK